MSKFIFVVLLVVSGLFLFATSPVALALVRITNLRDFSFGTVYPPYTDQIDTDTRVCIYNSASRRYSLTMTGDHDSGIDFFLASGTGDTIGYQVFWKRRSNASFYQMAAAVPAGFRGAYRGNQFCTGMPNRRWAQLQIKIPAASFTPTPKRGTYSDRLSILLEPI